MAIYNPSMVTEGIIREATKTLPIVMEITPDTDPGEILKVCDMAVAAAINDKAPKDDLYLRNIRLTVPDYDGRFAKKILNCINSVVEAYRPMTVIFEGRGEHAIDEKS